MAVRARKKGASSKKKASKKKASRKKPPKKSVAAGRRPRKEGGYTREPETPVSLDVTLDGETKVATLSRMGTPTSLRFKDGTESVTLICRPAQE